MGRERLFFGAGGVEVGLGVIYPVRAELGESRFLLELCGGRRAIKIFYTIDWG